MLFTSISMLCHHNQLMSSPKLIRSMTLSYKNCSLKKSFSVIDWIVFECLVCVCCLKTVCLSQVQSTVERVIVFLLSQVVERSSEEEALFSLHPCTESCKLLWRDSRVVGFYSFKPKGRMEDKSERVVVVEEEKDEIVMLFLFPRCTCKSWSLHYEHWYWFLLNVRINCFILTSLKVISILWRFWH